MKNEPYVKMDKLLELKADNELTKRFAVYLNQFIASMKEGYIEVRLMEDVIEPIAERLGIDCVWDYLGNFDPDLDL
jgi:energy-converting hydrogenase A subunit M